MVIDDSPNSRVARLSLIIRSSQRPHTVRKMVLKGKNVLLRALEREDLQLLHTWQNDESIMRLARSYPESMISLEALQGEYEKAIKGEDHEKQGFIIEERSSGKAIGWASIRQWGRKPVGAD